MKVDPVTTEVVASRLREIASSMEYALYHSGYSPILRELKGRHCRPDDAVGRVVIISGGLQYHFTAYQQAVQAVLARYPAASLKLGESFITNDPYKGGSPHAPDFVAVTPAFHAGILIGFGVSLAHKLDIGGLVPGSSGAAAREFIMTACYCRRFAFKARQALTRRSKPSSPITVASPKSSLVISVRKSAAPGSAAPDCWPCATSTAAISSAT